MNQDLRGLLDRLNAAVKEIRSFPVTEEETPDLAGEINYAANSLTAHKRSLMAEVGAETTGEHYKLIFENAAKRNYNTARLLNDIAGAQNISMIEALLEVIALDVVRLDWRWTALQKYANRIGLDLVIRKRGATEDGDMDSPHVGEMWTNRPVLKAAADTGGAL